MVVAALGATVHEEGNMTAKMVSNRHTPSRDKDYCLPRKGTAARLRYQSPVQRQVEGDQGVKQTRYSQHPSRILLPRPQCKTRSDAHPTQ